MNGVKKDKTEISKRGREKERERDRKGKKFRITLL